jgi:N-acetylglucosaminyldiphosphoundecaprenol N-acetyl-beta-D-mannosaminyltransferase
MDAMDDDALRDALASAALVMPDGAPVAWLMRRTGRADAQRVAGPDLMWAVIREGRSLGLRHALFGSTPSVVGRLTERLAEDVPGALVVSSQAPDPGSEYDEEALSELRAAAPDVVWVALGAPKQEKWMRFAASRLPTSTLIGVGAAFDFHAGTKRRAPRWMQRVGLEWAFRLGSEPRRLAWRYLRTNSKFLVYAGRSLSGGSA